MIRIPLFNTFGGDAASEQKLNQTQAESSAASERDAVVHPLDAVTGGVFSAMTSSDRAACVRAWLSSNPDVAMMQEVYKELSLRDKGAAKPLREKLNEVKRGKEQDALAIEWAAKAEALLQASKRNMADAMAWQRDAAKAGAPLSKEPLLTLRNCLTAWIQDVEDLQIRTQVQREAAVLLAQRIELLSAKSWKEADIAQAGLQEDLIHWHEQTMQLQQADNWSSLDARYASQLESATQQLDLVARAFDDALAQVRAASNDASKPLPPVQVWADELRAVRGEVMVAISDQARPTTIAQSDKSAAHVARRREGQEVISSLVHSLEQELVNGHSKNAITAAHALREAMKHHGRFLEQTLETHVQVVLAKVGELDDWQRWRANQIRMELVQKAEALIRRNISDQETQHPAAQKTYVNAEQAQPGTESSIADQTDASESVDTPIAQSQIEQSTDASHELIDLPTSSHSPRKLQELLRQLREQWKEVDQGGTPNHVLWRRFDKACNEAYRIVDAWLTEMKQHATEQKVLRLSLLQELKAWSERLAASASRGDVDWKAAHRELGEFSRRWREAGHVSEKVFAELQPQWKSALQHAAKPLDAAQQASVAQRQQMIEEATVLANAPLRIDAIRGLQQRWQQEAQRMPLDRRQEQKLWDAFRKPIDEAFQRKKQQREHVATALNQRDQAVLDAARELDAVINGGNAQSIRQAMLALEAATREQQTQPAQVHDAAVPIGAEVEMDAVSSNQEKEIAAESVRSMPRQVVAMRGDDRPGARITATDSSKRSLRHDNNSHARMRDDRNKGNRERVQRLGDAAFRAQRDAMGRAQAALRKLAEQVHGEMQLQLLCAWEKRDAQLLPAAGLLSKKTGNVQRALWMTALIENAASVGEVSADEALLRLEIAAEIPTPAQYLDARRALQLQLLTRRNDPVPEQTWAEDVARVLSTLYEAEKARRLQGALRILLKQ